MQKKHTADLLFICLEECAHQGRTGSGYRPSNKRFLTRGSHGSPAGTFSCTVARGFLGLPRQCWNSRTSPETAFPPCLPKDDSHETSDDSHETSLRKAFCHTLKHLGIEVEVVGMHTATWYSGLCDDDFLQRCRMHPEGNAFAKSARDCQSSSGPPGKCLSQEEWKS